MLRTLSRNQAKLHFGRHCSSQKIVAEDKSVTNKIERVLPMLDGIRMEIVASEKRIIKSSRRSAFVQFFVFLVIFIIIEIGIGRDINVVYNYNVTALNEAEPTHLE